MPTLRHPRSPSHTKKRKHSCRQDNQTADTSQRLQLRHSRLSNLVRSKSLFPNMFKLGRSFQDYGIRIEKPYVREASVIAVQRFDHIPSAEMEIRSRLCGPSAAEGRTLDYQLQRAWPSGTTSCILDDLFLCAYAGSREFPRLANKHLAKC